MIYPSMASIRIFPFTLFTSKSTPVSSPVLKLYVTIRCLSSDRRLYVSPSSMGVIPLMSFARYVPFTMSFNSRFSAFASPACMPVMMSRAVMILFPLRSIVSVFISVCFLLTATKVVIIREIFAGRELKDAKTPEIFLFAE